MFTNVYYPCISRLGKCMKRLFDTILVFIFVMVVLTMCAMYMNFDIYIFGICFDSAKMHAINLFASISDSQHAQSASMFVGVRICI